MNVLVVQLDIAWEDKKANFARVEEIVAAAAPSAGSLVALPETFSTGFSMNAMTYCIYVT